MILQILRITVLVTINEWALPKKLLNNKTTKTIWRKKIKNPVFQLKKDWLLKMGF